VSKKKKNTPSLDLSFAYGTTIIKRLSEHDIRMFQAAEAAANESGHSDDPTIRTVTSLFTGKRGIKGLGYGDAEPSADTESDAEPDTDPNEVS
jgi:hypothetical protein